MFIGWENSASLAEETSNPRHAVPRAIYLSIALMALSYVLFAYVTVVGYEYRAGALAANVAGWCVIGRSRVTGGPLRATMAAALPAR